METGEEPGRIPNPDWQTLRQNVETWIANGETDIYRRAREEVDRILILRAMQATEGNQLRVAEILGLSRVTLRSKLRSMGLCVEKVVTPETDRRLDKGAREP